VEFRVCGLLLDLDGTLVDSTAVVDKHWGRIADELGLPRTEVVGRFHGMTAAETMRKIAPSLSDTEISSLVNDLLAGEIADADLVSALPGALALLERLPDDAWVVVTSGPLELAVARLAGAGLPRPERLVTAESVSSGKPEPDPYLLGAELLGHAPADCLAIEDAPAGVRSAVTAGCQCLGLRTTHGELEVPSVPDLSSVRLSFDDARLVVHTP
jgi:sugar-phosphatase